MKEKVEGERAEVEEGRYESPILQQYISRVLVLDVSKDGDYLILYKDSSEAVEELERGNDMTLDEY